MALTGVLSASLPLLAEEDWQNEVIYTYRLSDEYNKSVNPLKHVCHYCTFCSAPMGSPFGVRLAPRRNHREVPLDRTGRLRWLHRLAGWRHRRAARHVAERSGSRRIEVVRENGQLDGGVRPARRQNAGPLVQRAPPHPPSLNVKPPGALRRLASATALGSGSGVRSRWARKYLRTRLYEYRISGRHGLEWCRKIFVAMESASTNMLASGPQKNCKTFPEPSARSPIFVDMLSIANI